MPTYEVELEDGRVFEIETEEPVIDQSQIESLVRSELEADQLRSLGTREPVLPDVAIPEALPIGQAQTVTPPFFRGLEAPPDIGPTIQCANYSRYSLWP